MWVPIVASAAFRLPWAGNTGNYFPVAPVSNTHAQVQATDRSFDLADAARLRVGGACARPQLPGADAGP